LAFRHDKVSVNFGKHPARARGHKQATIEGGTQSPSLAASMNFFARVNLHPLRYYGTCALVQHHGLAHSDSSSAYQNQRLSKRIMKSSSHQPLLTVELALRII
jgi:hypothetical protein